MSRKVLIEASPAWRAMLGSPAFAEGSQDLVEFTDDPVRIMEILFRALHNGEDAITYKASMKEIW